MLTIKILGPQCRKRNRILARIRNTLEEAGIAYEIILVTDVFEIMSHGRLATPAVIVNGKVVSMKIVPKAHDILKWAQLV